MIPLADRSRSPKKKVELLRIELLRKLLCKRTGGEVCLVGFPDEDKADERQGGCDAILEGKHDRFAVEVTRIDSFLGQRSDDARFQKVMGDLEQRVGTIKDWVEITIDVGAIPTGHDWGKLSLGIEEWLLGHLQDLPYDRAVPVDILGIPFVVRIRREHGRGQGRLVVARHAPVEIEEQRSAVIKRALEEKRSILSYYKSKGFSTLLLLESHDVALANRGLICDAFKKVSPLELCANAIDDVYLIETDTSPWAISPLKIGPQIFDEPSPEWPDAPGYPYTDILQA